MAGPWEQYQTAVEGPWAKYAAPATPTGEIPGPRQEVPMWRQMLGPAAEAAGGLIGGAIGTAAGTVAAPTVVVNPISGGIAGAALGYGAAKQGLRALDVALGYEQPKTAAGEFTEAAKNVGEGALYESGGRVLMGPVLNVLAKGAGKIIDINQLPKQLAARISRQTFETPETLAAAKTALEAAPEGLTAQQALAREGVISPGTQAVIQKAVARTAPGVQAAKEAAQEAERMATIKGVTPDLDAAVNARRAASKPLYAAADKAVVPIDADLSAVLERMPAGTLGKAAEIAKMEGRPFVMGKTVPAQSVETGVLDAAGNPVMKEVPAQQAKITGESLHYIKRALSDIAYGPVAATGAGRDAQLAARGLLDDFVTTFESKVPAYGQARRVFSDMSAPVNQAQVLKEMASVLEKPGGGERIGPFLNVLGRGEEAMLKRAGGRGGPRFEALTEVLTPDQLATVKEVAKQLETEASIGKQITAGQQRAAQLIKDELPNYRLPNVFNVFATTANKVLDILGLKVGKRAIEQIEKASQSAKSFDELLNTLPGAERSKVLKAISDPDTWKNVRTLPGKVAMGATAEMPSMPANNLTQTENQNALAR